MANMDKPRGWQPVAMRGGGGYTPVQIMNSAGSEIIYIHDALTVSSGVVDPLDTGQATIGVSSIYSTAVADNEIPVYSDPDQAYRVQADDSNSVLTASTYRYTHYDLLATTGDTGSQMSKQEVDASRTDDDLFIIWDLWPTPGNAWGDNCEIWGVFLEHQGRPVSDLAAQ